MKKKDKVKPRTQIFGSSLKERTFNYYIRETEEDTKVYLTKLTQITLTFICFNQLTMKKK